MEATFELARANHQPVLRPRRDEFTEFNVEVYDGEVTVIYSNVFLTVKEEADVDKVQQLLIQQGALSKPGTGLREVRGLPFKKRAKVLHVDRAVGIAATP